MSQTTRRYEISLKSSSIKILVVTERLDFLSCLSFFFYDPLASAFTLNERSGGHYQILNVVDGGDGDGGGSQGPMG